MLIKGSGKQHKEMKRPWIRRKKKEWWGLQQSGPHTPHLNRRAVLSGKSTSWLVPGGNTANGTTTSYLREARHLDLCMKSSKAKVDNKLTCFKSTLHGQKRRCTVDRSMGCQFATSGLVACSMHGYGSINGHFCYHPCFWMESSLPK